MNYTKHSLGAYNLHLIKTDKFKTIRVEVSLKKQIEKVDSTYHNLLCELMLLSTKKYKTKREFIIKKQELYSSSIGAYTHRYGNYINTTFWLNALEDKFTEEGNFEEALEFFHDFLFNVDVENAAFNQENFQNEKNNYLLDLDGIKEDPGNYSAIRLYEEMEKDTSSAYRLTGYKEVLESITAESLYEYYEEMLRTNLVDIFVIGNFDEKQMLESIKKIMPFHVLKKKRVDYLLQERDAHKKRKTLTESSENLQSKLAYGFKYSNLSTYERNYVLTLFNIIFGGGAESKLFREIREKNSLCYYIYSVCNKFDHNILVRAGIDKKNSDQTVLLIDKELLNMQKGKFDLDDIKKAQELYLTVLDTIEENQTQIISDYLMMEILNTDSRDEKRKKIMEVSKEDIIKLAKKIKGDTVFCLEGDKS